MSTATVVAPEHLWVPAHAVGSYGDMAADLADLYGRPLDPEQRVAVDAFMAHDARGRWAALEACRVEPRQNGKTGGEVTAVTLADLFLFPPDVITWTAHLFKTAREAFDDHKTLIQSTPELDRRVAKIIEANGEEAIILTTGAKLQYLARSKGGGRGLGGKRVVMDEALIPMPLAALLPTMAARGDAAQILYASSAGIETSEQLRALRDRGRAGGDPSLVYVEHCAPQGGCRSEDCDHQLGVDGCALDNEDNWLRANHALDVRITRDYVRSERRALSPEEFARERLGWWSDPGTAEMPYPVKAWDDLAGPFFTGQLGDPVAFVDTNPIRSRTAVVVCGDDDAGSDYLELVEYRPGTAWVVEFCKRLSSSTRPRFALFESSAAASLLPEFEKAGLAVDVLSNRELVRACGSMFDAVSDKTFRHAGQDELHEAVLMARKRNLEGAWALARKGGDIAPLVAAVGARHLHAGEVDLVPLLGFA